MKGLLVSVVALAVFLLIVYAVFAGLSKRYGTMRVNGTASVIHSY